VTRLSTPEHFQTGFAARAPAFELRDAGFEDAPFLRRLFFATQAEVLALPDALLEMQYESQRRTYAAYYPEAMHALVVRRGAPIGQIMIDWSGPDAFHLVDLTIHPKERNGAAGLHLLRAWIASADRFGKLATLFVRPGAPVIGLYRRLGLVVMSENEVPIRMERRSRCDKLGATTSTQR
jgi:ribosomal protein S18 acetylase RimI-like enzyme